jgi:hypothetical protein
MLKDIVDNVLAGQPFQRVAGSIPASPIQNPALDSVTRDLFVHQNLPKTGSLEVNRPICGKSLLQVTKGLKKILFSHNCVSWTKKSLLFRRYAEQRMDKRPASLRLK